MKLFCFPNAGGSATRFSGWKKKIPPSITLVPIEYPGRGLKLDRPFAEDLSSLVTLLLKEISPSLSSPFAFLGHSMGATVAFELARALQVRDLPTPIFLFLSGRRAPHISGTSHLHTLSDAKLIDTLAKLGGLPPQLLGHTDALQLFLPIIRADLKLLELWEPRVEGQVRADLCVLGGTDDPLAPLGDLLAWKEHVHGDVQAHFFPGGHFYLDACVDQVIATVVEAVLPPRMATSS